VSAPRWTQAQAIDLCRAIESIAPQYGCHVALTGGTLYRDGERKDADILFYRIRQVEQIDVPGLMEALRGIGVTPGRDFGWCYKATFESRTIDFFFPERPDFMEPPGYGRAALELEAAP
jgi:hypothetical protein